MLLEEKDEYLTPALVAARLKVSQPTVFRWLSPKADPRLESIRLGANRRIPERALKVFLEKVGK
jgi:excisionase family DNA binding protein